MTTENMPIIKNGRNTAKSPEDLLKEISRLKSQLASDRRANTELKKAGNRPTLHFRIEGPNLTLREQIQAHGKPFVNTVTVIQGEEYSDLLRVMRPFVELVNSLLKGNPIDKGRPSMVRDHDTNKMVQRTDEENRKIMTPSPIQKLEANYKRLLSEPTVVTSLQSITDVIKTFRAESEENNSGSPTTMG